MKICCENCAYIDIQDFDKLDKSSGKGLFVCKFHNLYNGELSFPQWQKCDDFTSVISKQRDKKIDDILNENSL